MSSRKHPPTRTLRDKPDLVQLKRQAKELLQAFAAGDADAAAEVNAHYQGANPARFALHDAQLVLARSYGFDSWPKLKAFVDGVTVRGLCDAVRAGDIDGVRAMLAVRPELVHLDVAEDDEHRALHHAVLQRRPEMVRLLMQHGADARKGIWPHRDATSPLTIATERGYADIVAIIREEERRRSRVSADRRRYAGAGRPGGRVRARRRRGDDRVARRASRAHPHVRSAKWDDGAPLGRGESVGPPGRLADRSRRGRRARATPRGRRRWISSGVKTRPAHPTDPV